MEGYPQKSETRTSETWVATVKNFKGIVLYRHYFYINQAFSDLDGEMSSENKTKIALLLPYFSTATKIIIYSPEGKQKATIDISKFADYCGDKRCSISENFAICSKDCPSGSRDNYCDKQYDRICDPDCSMFNDIDCYMPPLTILISIIGASSIILYILRRYRKLFS